ncbi:hypothetical protein NMT12_190028 [metagenome]
MNEKLPLVQDVDYMSSYADGFFLKLDHETHTVRLVFYKKDAKFQNRIHDSLPDEFVKNTIFEVRIPNSAFTGFLDISYKFNKYREEIENEEAMEDEELSDIFSQYSEKLALTTFDTSNPAEHDKELEAKFLYYISKRQDKETKNESNEQQSD